MEITVQAGEGPQPPGEAKRVWTQNWVVGAGAAPDAREAVVQLLARWTPDGQEAAAVGEVRALTGPDELALGDQYVEELRDIRELAAKTPRESLAHRFALLRQRPLGIPPRPGWVVAGGDGPRSPRPLDWTGRHGPRWVVTVEWPGSPPELPGPSDLP